MAGGRQQQQFYKSDQLPVSPYFTSLAKRYSAQVGAGVTLACKVENLGKRILLFVFSVPSLRVGTHTILQNYFKILIKY